MSEAETTADRWENEGGQNNLAQPQPLQSRCCNQTETPFKVAFPNQNNKLKKIIMQAQTGHIAEKSEESKTADKSAVIAVYDTHVEAEEAVRELQISGFARNLTEFGKMVKIQEAENQITTLMMPSQLALDICNQHFLCRMAKKLGCQFCVQQPPD